MSRIFFLLLFIAAIAVSGCANSLPAKGKAEAPQTGVSDEARAEFERKLLERMKEEEEIFNVFSKRMDEYQNLLEVCDHVSQAPDDSALKASCASRLKAMREELSELSDLLRDGR